MNRELLEAINIQAKREGIFWPVLRAIIFEQLDQRFPAKSLLSILSDHRGGSWGSDQQAGLLPAPSLRSPDIRHGRIDYSQAEIRYYTPKELEKHRLQSGDILVIKSNGSLDLVGKSQLFVTPDDASPVTASNFVLVVSPDRKQVDPTYLDWFLKSPQALAWRVDKQRTTTGLRNLDSEGYLATSVPVPPNLEIQIEITGVISAIEDGEWPVNPYFDIALAERAKQVADTFENFSSESDYQQSLLAKLKQAILQEAIEGKLTADWRAAHPDVEPASQLLHRIQAEKARLIAAKTLRPEKPLPKITAAEIPFEIPEGWEWCRIAEATVTIVDCPHSTPQWTTSGMTCVKTSNFRRFHLDLSSRFFVSQQTYEERVERLVPQPDDILYSREGSILGIACRIPAGEKLCLGQRMMLLRPPAPEASAFLELMLNSPHVTRIADESTLGGCSPHINVGEIKAFVIPLPPLAEQAAIVERVEALMTTCRALEAEIGQARRHADQLLQAVLKEAFAPASGVS